jgi:hypothetical protein
MAECCEADRRSPLEMLPAGLDSLPRQVSGFPEVRTALLASLSGYPALAGMRPSGGDFGLMWLEMWAYVADLIAFYDERIANETYLRTAVRQSSLRRAVKVLGYKPLPGVAGSALVAAFAEGDVSVTLPVGTQFRSRGFDGNPPQVFESGVETQIHRLANSWTVTPFKRRPTIDTAESGEAATVSKGASSSGDSSVDHLLFEPQGFGLAVDDLVLFDSRDPETALPLQPAVTRVMAVDPFTGKDGLSYLRVEFDPPVSIPADFDLTQLRVRKPLRTRAATVNKPLLKDAPKESINPIEAVSTPANGVRVFFDGAPEGFRRSDSVIIARGVATFEADYAATTVDSIRAAAVRVDSIPQQTVIVPDGPNVTVPSPTVAATEVVLAAATFYTLGTSQQELSFHFAFVDGGRATNVGRTRLKPDDLAGADGVPIAGIVSPPPQAEAAAAIGQANTIAGILERKFLLRDAAMNGALVDGRLTFDRAGRASFEALDQAQLPAEMRLPLTIYGNIIEVTRGESVTGEILGDGNARIANQKFKLKKKPLTYLPTPSDSNQVGVESTLRLYVSGVRWQEVRSFFGCGPTDEVFVVEHDDEQNTFIIGGDSVRGRRFDTGIKNIVANYRYGSGAAAPPAGAINQLGAALKGLRSVVSPLAALAGKDADLPGDMRQNAPRTALLFGRAVSAADYEAIAANSSGVVRASAEWLWIDAQMQAGVRVRFIGDTTASAISEALRIVADPTVPLEVIKATPIPATITISVEVDPRHVRAAVAAAVSAHLTDSEFGVLSPCRAAIGGPFVPSAIYLAASEVDGVVGVNGLTVVTPAGAPPVSNVAPTCLSANSYLDFTAVGAVVVNGVEPAGNLPPRRSAARLAT